MASIKVGLVGTFAYLEISLVIAASTVAGSCISGDDTACWNEFSIRFEQEMGIERVCTLASETLI